MGGNSTKESTDVICEQDLIGGMFVKSKAGDLNVVKKGVENDKIVLEEKKNDAIVENVVEHVIENVIEFVEKAAKMEDENAVEPVQKNLKDDEEKASKKSKKDKKKSEKKKLKSDKKKRKKE